MRKRDPIDENILTQLWSEGKSDHEIAKILGFSQTGITRARHRIGLKANFHHPANEKDRDPKTMYKEHLKRSGVWKNNNPKMVKQQAEDWRHKNKDYRKIKARVIRREQRPRPFITTVKAYSFFNSKGKLIQVSEHKKKVGSGLWGKVINPGGKNGRASSCK